MGKIVSQLRDGRLVVEVKPQVTGGGTLASFYAGNVFGVGVEWIPPKPDFKIAIQDRCLVVERAEPEPDDYQALGAQLAQTIIANCPALRAAVERRRRQAPPTSPPPAPSRRVVLVPRTQTLAQPARARARRVHATRTTSPPGGDDGDGEPPRPPASRCPDRPALVGDLLILGRAVSR